MAKRVLTALVAVGMLGATMIVAVSSIAGAQVTVTGQPDDTGGVFLFTAGTDTGEPGTCNGTPGGTPTDDIVNFAVQNTILEFIGDTDAEIVTYTPGSDIELPPGVQPDLTNAELNQGLTAIDDFGNISNGDDDAANADIGNGGQLVLRLAEGLVIAPDGVATNGILSNGTNPTENLDGFEIFMFEDAELSGMTVGLQGPTQFLTFDVADYQINPNTAAGADDTLLAIDLDTLAGWTDPYVISLSFIDDTINSGGLSDCPFGTLIDTSVEIDAVAVRADVLILEPSINIEKSTNGEDADAAPGPLLSVGDPVTWTYTVLNDGEQFLSNIVVTDNVIGAITCPQDTLDVGETMVCEATGVATLGQYENIGTADAISDTGAPVTDNDPSHYLVSSVPAIDIIKYVNGEDANDAPGVEVEVGDTITYRYDVTNTGNSPLTGVQVNDDILGFICDIGDLAVGASDSCTTTAIAVEGLVTNVGTATGADPGGTPVTDDDPANYTGDALPGLDLEKFVNGDDADTPTGPTIYPGETASFTYVVTNNGNVTIREIDVTDDILGLICEIPSLAAGASQTCSADSLAVPGQYVNLGTATGIDTQGQPISDTDPAHYFGAEPSVDLEKATNGSDSDLAPGENIVAGSTVTWTYEVTNNGNVDLTDVVVTDDVLGTICTIDTLAVGATDSCTATGVAQQGPYTNLGTATGSAPNGSTVTDTDPSNYTGVVGSIDVEKATNGQDADVAPGPSLLAGSTVEWTYVVTNTGPVALTNVSVTDDLEGLICDGLSLDPGESATCTATGTATGGPYTNVATATGTDPGGNTPSDTDPSNYMGVIDGIFIEKATNGEDADDAPGPYVNPGDTVTWTYVVTNAGNLAVTDVVVTDDVIGLICEIASIAAASSETCTATGVAELGQYENVATVTATGPTGNTLTDDDPSHYFGQDPSIIVEKATNGDDADTAPGPFVAVGDSVTWTYVVTNTGNVALTDVVVTDDQEGQICTFPTMAPGETQTCTATGIAEAGQYTNQATVTGDDPTGTPVEDEDPSNYFGQEPGISIVKATNGVVVPSGESGPLIPEGDPVTWTYTITNTGNVELVDVVAVDDQVGVVCTFATLAPGAVEECSVTGVAVLGQYNNNVAVSGDDPLGNPVADEDDSAYFGAGPDLLVEKSTNGVDADTPAEGPMITVGDQVEWTYVITNTGNVTLVDVAVTDDQVGAVCTIASLAVGATETCSVLGTATEGQYRNEATATGTDPNGDTVEDEDPSHYFGSNPGISIDKKVNGVDAPTPTGPVVPVGSTGIWTFLVINTGNVDLTNVVVDDDIFGLVCTIGDLAVGAEETCEIQAPVEAGQHTNIATVTGDDPEGNPVTDEDTSNIFGSGPGVNIEKTTNGLDSDDAPGGNIAVGDVVTWEYTATNTGNVILLNVVITDDQEGTICTIPSLAVGQSDSCTKTGVAVEGPYANNATATGTTEQDVPVEDEDPSHYTGVIGALGDYVWVDLNENGQQDAGEPGVAGVPVELLDASGAIVAETITDANGLYLFADVVPGQYSVQFIIDGNPFTTQATGDPATDSDVDPATGLTGAVTAPTSGANLDVDAGVLPASLGDFVWFDENKDGIQDPGELGYEGITVNLYIDTDGDGMPNGDPIATTTTVDGDYRFDGLDPQQDHIVEFMVADRAFSPALVGDDRTIDSDAAPGTGLTAVVDLAFGEYNPTIDAGVSPNPGSIGDTVWIDLNGDDVQDGDEVGIADVTIQLLDGDGNLIAETVTDADGKYLFTNLLEGSYMVQVDPSTLPAGLELTFDLNGPLDGKSSVDLEEGENALDHDFGYLPLAAIGDYVWEDTDGDGIQGADEVGVADVTVVLWTVVDGVPVEEVATTTTDADGGYMFTRVDPRNDYVVQVTPADGWIVTELNAGDDITVDNNIDPTSGLSETISLEPGEVNPTIDIGILRAPAGIGDTVWMDLNENGVQDNDEKGIPDIEIKLWTVDADGALATEQDTTTTDANGKYAFVNLDPDVDYAIQVLSPDGWLLTDANIGPSDEVDSDVDPATGISDVISLDPGENDPTIDAGLLPIFPEIELVVLSDTARISDGDEHPLKVVGSDVTLTYTATNTGDWPLTNVVISDPVHGEICVIASLAIGESESCTEVVQTIPELVEALATVTGEPVDDDGNPATQLDGTPVNDVDDTDPLAYEGFDVLPTTLPTVTPAPTSTVVPTATARPTSTPVPPPIAVTGQNSDSLAFVAVGMVLAGAALVMTGNRRRKLTD